MTRPTPISTAKAAQPTASYSQAIAYGSLIATGGQVGRDPATGNLAHDLETQVTQAIDNLEQVLLAAGSDLKSVIKTNCFLSDIEQFNRFDAAYRSRFSSPFPARSTVGVRLAGDLQFEIEAWAVLSEDEL